MSLVRQTGSQLLLLFSSLFMIVYVYICCYYYNSPINKDISLATSVVLIDCYYFAWGAGTIVCACIM